jgi:hypothetical protein
MSENSGACVQCGRDDWVRAKFTLKGTVCEKCLRPSPRRRDREPPAQSFLDQVLAVANAERDGRPRHLARDEAERLYPGRVSPGYGKPRWPAPARKAL